ncbi:hypothetical protein FS842_008213 [Serendipita sp. 407]|nr:hypothetical protein FS842_008213 [Serendipita sp. 407]
MTTKPPTQEMSEATPPPKTAEVERSIASQACERCHSPITGQYVRAMGTVYHVDCFRCIDCNEIVTAKFFSYTMPDSKQIPLCEVDYFKSVGRLYEGVTSPLLTRSTTWNTSHVHAALHNLALRTLIMSTKILRGLKHIVITITALDAPKSVLAVKPPFFDNISR